MPGGGPTAARAISSRAPETSVIAFSAYDDDASQVGDARRRRRELRGQGAVAARDSRVDPRGRPARLRLAGSITGTRCQGSHHSRTVPSPRALSMRNVPPVIAARSRMLASPRWPEPAATSSRSNPIPSSVTRVAIPGSLSLDDHFDPGRRGRGAGRCRAPPARSGTGRSGSRRTVRRRSGSRGSSRRRHRRRSRRAAPRAPRATPSGRAPAVGARTAEPGPAGSSSRRSVPATRRAPRCSGSSIRFPSIRSRMPTATMAWIASSWTSPAMRSRSSSAARTSAPTSCALSADARSASSARSARLRITRRSAAQ